MIKKAMYFLLLPLLFSCFSYAAPHHSNNKIKDNSSIDGIFNIYFETPIVKYNILEKKKIDYEKSYYLVGNGKVPSEYKKYIDEIAVIESKDGKVHEVWGIGSEINRKVCNIEKDEIVSLLQNKYGEEKPAKDFNPDEDKRIIDHKGNEIYITCQGLMFSNLYVKFKEKQ